MSFPPIHDLANSWFSDLPTPLLIFFLVVAGLVVLVFVLAILGFIWTIIAAIFGLGRGASRSYGPRADFNDYSNTAGQRMSRRDSKRWANSVQNPANINSLLNPNNPVNVARREHHHAQQNAQRASQQAHQQAQQNAQRAHHQAQQSAQRSHQQAQQNAQRAHQQAMRSANQSMHRHKH